MATYAAKLDRVSPSNMVFNLNRCGLPALNTVGKIFYVAPATSAIRPRWIETQENVYTTLLAAYTQTVTGRNDVIVLSPDSHALAATLTIAKDRVHIVGADVAGRHFGQRARISFANGIAETLKAAVIVTGDGCSMTGVKIINNNTDTDVKWGLSDEGEYNIYQNCSFENWGQAAVSVAGEVNLASDCVTFKDCTFGSTSVTQTGALHPNLNITSITDGYLENCLFYRKAGATTNIFVYGTGAQIVTRSLILKSCVFFNPINASTMAAAVHFATDLTSGVVLLDQCVSAGDITIQATTSKHVYVSGAVPTGASSGVAVTA